MPNLLASDAKRCRIVGNLLAGEKFSDNELVQRATETGMELWRHIGREFLDADDVGDVLPFGGDKRAVESILPKLPTPSATGEACGEYTGAIVVQTGFLSIRESLNMAEATDPTIWEKMGRTRAELDSGLNLIEAQAAELGGASIADKVSCVAIYHANKMTDPSLAAYSNIWMTSLVSAIQDGQVAPDDIRAQSEYWRALANNGVEGLTKLSGYEAQNASCEAQVDQAVSAQAEGT